MNKVQAHIATLLMALIPLLLLAQIMPILQAMMVTVALKAMIIGSEFNFYYLLRDGRKYLDWYHNRERYQEEQA